MFSLGGLGFRNSLRIAKVAKFVQITSKGIYRWRATQIYALLTAAYLYKYDATANKFDKLKEKFIKIIHL